MMLIENFRLALYSLMANKMRALLTMLGIIIGIASVIAIMTVGNSITNSVSSSMSSMGANNIEVGLTMREGEEEVTEDGIVIEDWDVAYEEPSPEDYFTQEMLERYIEEYPDSIAGIALSENVIAGRIEDGSLYANVSVVGVNTGYFLGNNTELVAGQFLAGSVMNSGANVCMVSEKVVENLYDSDADKAIGETVQVETDGNFYRFTIIGVYEYNDSAAMFNVGSGRDIQTNLFIPIQTAQELNHSEGFSQFTVITKSGVDADAFAADTANFFEAYYRNNRTFAPDAYSMAAMAGVVTEMLGTITTAISVIAGIALLVGGIGVMNIMLVSVTERTREIGTRKALGAPNSAIRLQFIIESIVICLIGGIIGILLGVSMGVGLVTLMGETAVPSVQSIIISLSFSMFIGIFFGYYPANKAAKMDPIDALRYE